MSILLYRPHLKRLEMDSVLTCIVSDSIGTGLIYNEFCTMLSDYTQGSSTMVFREPTRAASFTLKALKIKKGATIGISPLASDLYLQVFKELEIIPYFIDVDSDCPTFSKTNLDEAKGKIDAIIVSYSLGFFPDTESIQALGIPVIEDISQAFFPSPKESPVFGQGDATLITFEEDGILHTGGGCAVSFKKNNIQNHAMENPEDFHHSQIITDFNAALGITQVQDMEEYKEKRLEIFRIFELAIMKSHHSHFIRKEDRYFFPFSFPVLLTGNMKEVIQYARKKTVETDAAFSHALINYFPEAMEKCPNAHRLILRCILFPLYPSLKRKDVDTIAKVLSTIP